MTITAFVSYLSLGLNALAIIIALLR